MQFDLPLSELEAYRPDVAVPEDFDWDEERDEFIRYAKRRALGASSSRSRASSRPAGSTATASTVRGRGSRPRSAPAASTW